VTSEYLVRCVGHVFIQQLLEARCEHVCGVLSIFLVADLLTLPPVVTFKLYRVACRILERLHGAVTVLATQGVQNAYKHSSITIWVLLRVSEIREDK
jgi:hypothetical protein